LTTIPRAHEIIWIGIAAATPAAQWMHQPIMTVEEQRHGSGYVAILPGIQCESWYLEPIVNGLRAAGLDWEIDIVLWGEGYFALQNLTDIRLNRERAAEVAADLAKYHRAHPDVPMVLIGYSGGGGMAVLVTEALPDDVMIDRLILMAPAVSPRHDMSRVLTRCRDKVINFYSARDRMVLGLGTRLFGTVDRDRNSSAGHVGLLNDAGVRIETATLSQIPWIPEWRKLGHRGGHMSWLSRAWAREVLAEQIDPSLAGSESDRDSAR
jgi:pimeloyl-ACP methyl ester carboxylesterase